MPAAISRDWASENLPGWKPANPTPSGAIRERLRVSVASGGFSSISPWAAVLSGRAGAQNGEDIGEHVHQRDGRIALAQWGQVQSRRTLTEVDKGVGIDGVGIGSGDKPVGRGGEAFL